MVKYVVSHSDDHRLPSEFVDTSVSGIREQVAALFPKTKLTFSTVEDIIIPRYKRGSKNVRLCVLTRDKPLIAKRTDLDYLNELREAKGKAPLTNWLSGAPALALAIQSEQGKPTNQAMEIHALITGEIPPIEYIKPGVARGAYRNKEEAKTATGQHPKLKWGKKRDLPAHRIVTPHKTERRSDGVSAADVLTKLGIDPRKGRALLRKNNVARDDPDAIRAFFKERGK